MWLDFTAQASFVDLTSLFKVPVNDILSEINWIDKQYLTERDQDQYKAMKESGAIGIGSKVDGQNNWSSLSLYSASGRTDDILTQGILTNEDYKTYRETFRNLKSHKWTPLANLMPKTVSWLRHNFFKYLKVSYIKVSKLEANGKIPLHTDMPEIDFDFSKPNTYNMLNSFLIELDPPQELTSYHDGKLIPYQSGSVFWCNQSKPHGTENFGNKNRYNIRIQGMYLKSFRELIKDNKDIIQCHPVEALENL